MSDEIKPLDSPPYLSENPFYLFLYQLAREEALQHVLEIGSSTGEGSTHWLVEALACHAEPPQLHCFEADPDKYQALKARYADKPWVHCYPYFSKIPVAFPDPEQVKAFYRENATVLRSYPLNEVLGWLKSEEAAYQARSSEISGIAWLKEQLGIRQFDMVVLDGAEFTGNADLDEVYGARILVLDDVNAYKNWANFQRLKADRRYVMLTEHLSWQHGMAVFKRQRPLRAGISAVVHTRNAAALLPECLQSLSWCDELLVVDMYSQDQTRELAAAVGARVVKHIPVDCVDEARNWGLSMVEHAWTLVLDADERLPESLSHLIQQTIQDPDAADGYWIPRQNIFFNQPVAALFPDYQLRLFRSQAAYWRGLVHELPLLLGQEAYFKPEPENAIQHYSYADVTSFFQRQLHYARTMWHQLGKYPGRPLLLEAHQLRSHFETQQHQLAESLRKSPVDNLEWVVRQLYLFSELATTAYFLEQSGQIQGRGFLKKPKLSAYSYLKNADLFDYPWIESLNSVLEVCDEVIVSYASDSQDKSSERLKAFAAEQPKLKLFETRLWETARLEGETIRLVAEEAMAACSGDWLWHLQADEVYTRADALEVRKLVTIYDSQPVHGFHFKVIHFYGDYETALAQQAAEIGWYQHTIRLARAGWGIHQGDAWTMSLKEDAPSAAIMTDIRIYHYGHVRHHEAMRLKSNYMERLYHDLPDNFSVCEPGDFVYDKVPEKYLRTFELPHPESMQLRIAAYQLHKNLASRTDRPRLLVLSRYHKVKKGFGITLNALYQTGILQRHFEVHQLAWHYEGQLTQLDGVQIYPCPEDTKLDAWREAIYRLAPDVILLHADAHFFIPYLKELEAWKGPVVGWFTVDYERPHNPKRLLPVYERCQRVLCMAEASITQTRKDYQGPVAKVPLGVDPQLFKPASQERKAQLRRELQIPEAEFVFLMVANNFWRKGIEYAVMTMAQFVETNPELTNVSLYMHTEHSESLSELIQAYGLQNRIRVSRGFDPFHQALETAELVKLYQMADAFLLTTLGEGFGMPVLEAQACGLPLVISDNSVLREVGGDAALYINCPGYVGGGNAGSHVWLRSPDPVRGAELMYQLYSSPALQAELSQAGIRQAAESPWQKTALLLAAELAIASKIGKLVYEPPEPVLRPV